MEAHIELCTWDMVPGSWDEVKCLKPICVLIYTGLPKHREGLTT